MESIMHKESIFSVEAVKRQKQQAEIEKKVGLNTKTETKESRKVPMNITLTAEHKNKLLSYAKEKHLSASLIIQAWVDKYCV